jgi:hypothetical protein
MCSGSNKGAAIVNKFLGLLLLVLGVWFLLKAVLVGAYLMLILAAGLAVAAAIGAVGKWAYGLAALFALVALPGLVSRTLFFGIAMLFKAGPVVLVLLGIYLLAAKAGRR